MKTDHWFYGLLQSAPEHPVVLLEVQMQGKAGFKHRLWAQTARFLQLHPQVQHLAVVVVVPHPGASTPSMTLRLRPVTAG